MSQEQAFEKAAQRHYKSEMADLQKVMEAMALTDNDWDPDKHDGQTLEEYQDEVREEAERTPLAVTTQVCIQVELSTGGPADGYTLFFEKGEDEPSSGYYWYQDWFMPKRLFWLSNEELEQVMSVYNIYVEG